MKNIISGALTIAALLIIGGGAIIYYFISSSYTTPQGLYEFPVPRNAELVQINEQGNRYEWSRASEENGIPNGYDLVLKASGWKKGEREGASVFYTKGNNTIDLLTTTKQLEILRVK
ncbi:MULTISPECIES: hypothetical protein [Peribacillus]|uniref:hypothetical protein n=1 Tax=Peribacillus TaxID=2675229 RepID=UPI001F4D6F9B|nr:MULTISPECIES: hypothetical protein [unclassified Peribacillus]MCK1983104.1 hypothetical protein [Peribacillus sp. Aquil_B1]MCK2009206.1 hypothetical protein [Peribacillus sp. Aquil_B8]